MSSFWIVAALALVAGVAVLKFSEDSYLESIPMQGVGGLWFAARETSVRAQEMAALHGGLQGYA